jgi:hypothetical protein
VEKKPLRGGANCNKLPRADSRLEGKLLVRCRLENEAVLRTIEMNSWGRKGKVKKRKERKNTRCSPWTDCIAAGLRLGSM